jgi:hypothetical protein
VIAAAFGDDAGRDPIGMRVVEALRLEEIDDVAGTAAAEVVEPAERRRRRPCRRSTSTTAAFAADRGRSSP